MHFFFEKQNFLKRVCAHTIQVLYTKHCAFDHVQVPRPRCCIVLCDLRRPPTLMDANTVLPLTRVRQSKPKSSRVSNPFNPHFVNHSHYINVSTANKCHFSQTVQ